MRKLRTGTIPTVVGFAASVIGLIAIRTHNGSTATLYVGALVFAVGATIIILSTLAWRKRQKLAKLVQNGSYAWAAQSLVISGDELLAGLNKQPHGPPGPKGTLTLTPDRQTLRWTPDKTAGTKNFETTGWQLVQTKIQFGPTKRDILGFKTFSIVIMPTNPNSESGSAQKPETGQIEMQYILPSSPLQDVLGK